MISGASPEFQQAAKQRSQVANLYGVSYPTVRNRLDDLISLLSDVMEAPNGNEVKDGE